MTLRFHPEGIAVDLEGPLKVRALDAAAHGVDARGAAKTLAHAFQHDTRPPAPTLALVLDWPRTNPDAGSQG